MGSLEKDDSSPCASTTPSQPSNKGTSSNHSANNVVSPNVSSSNCTSPSVDLLDEVASSRTAVAGRADGIRLRPCIRMQLKPASALTSSRASRGLGTPRRKSPVRFSGTLNASMNVGNQNVANERHDKRLDDESPLISPKEQDVCNGESPVSRGRRSMGVDIGVATSPRKATPAKLSAASSRKPNGRRGSEHPKKSRQDAQDGFNSPVSPC